jgi:hypothetical protein
MRHLFFLLLLIVLISCDKDFKAPKPAILIEKSMMEDILYDISLLKAAKSKKFKVLNDNNVQTDFYIYKKYKIDSIILRQNIEYYATNSFKTAKEIEDEVALRFKSKKLEIENNILAKENIKKDKDSIKQRNAKKEITVSK